MFVFLSYICLNSNKNRTGSVMVRVLASSSVYHGFEPWSGQTKDYKIGICCFSAKHAALRRNTKDWLAQNQDNVSEWGDSSICGLLFQWASTTKSQPIILVKYKADLIVVSLIINLFSSWYSWKIAELALKQQSHTHSITIVHTSHFIGSFLGRCVPVSHHASPSDDATTTENDAYYATEYDVTTKSTVFFSIQTCPTYW